MRDTERRGDTGRGRSRLPVRSPMGDSISGPQDHALRWRQTLNHWVTLVPRKNPFLDIPNHLILIDEQTETHRGWASQLADRAGPWTLCPAVEPVAHPGPTLSFPFLWCCVSFFVSPCCWPVRKLQRQGHINNRRQELFLNVEIS